MRISSGTLPSVMLLFPLLLTSCKSKPFSDDALAFVRPGETTRQEIVENFGQPTYESTDHLLIAYAQETIRAIVTTRAIRWEERHSENRRAHGRNRSQKTRALFCLRH